MAGAGPKPAPAPGRRGATPISDRTILRVLGWLVLLTRTTAANRRSVTILIM
jgi:hypothetical protein